MRARHPLHLVLRSAALALPLAAMAPSSCENVAPYALRPESAVTQGCFEPCMCPVWLLQPLAGRFLLVEQRRDEPAPFREFAVVFVDWKLERGGEVVPITGSGRYRVGGEVALQQRMELDLRFGDAPAQHFDSGLVAGGGAFPEIDVRVSVNQQVCLDTVIDILASPG